MIISCLPPKSTHYHASQTCDSLQILLHTFYQLSADCKMHQVILTWSLHVGLSTVSWPHDTNITWESTLLFFVKRGCFLHNMYYCYGCHHYRKLSYRGSDVIMLFCKLVKSTPFSDLDEKINPFHWLYDNMTYMGPSLRNMTLTRHLLEKYDTYKAPPWEIWHLWGTSSRNMSYTSPSLKNMTFMITSLRSSLQSCGRNNL